MKVLVLSNLYPPDFIGGYELACSQVVDALRSRGHDVRVLTARPRQLVPGVPHVHRRFHLTDEWNAYAMGTHPVAYRAREAESRVVNAYNIHVLTAALEEFAPEVVYVNNVVGLGGLGLVGCLQYLKVPWVWHLGDCIPRELCSTSDGINPRLAAQFAREVRGTYTVVSRRILDEDSNDGLALNGRVELLPYWITGERPPPRRRYYRGGHLRIMAAGRVNLQKGFDILIESAGRLRDAGFDDFSVDIFGKVSDPFFAALIRNLKLTGHVRLSGVRPQAELIRLYGEYDVFAFPTQEREPFGLVPLEAAARGCVPVMTFNCGVAEWLVHGVHCLKAARKPEAFARVFRQILEGAIPLEPVARRAAEAAWRDFHLDTLLPRIEGLLRDASTQSRAGAGSADDAYRMARMAEQLTQSLTQDAFCG